MFELANHLFFNPWGPSCNYDFSSFTKTSLVLLVILVLTAFVYFMHSEGLGCLFWPHIILFWCRLGWNCFLARLILMLLSALHGELLFVSVDFLLMIPIDFCHCHFYALRRHPTLLLGMTQMQKFQCHITSLKNFCFLLFGKILIKI